MPRSEEGSRIEKAPEREVSRVFSDSMISIVSGTLAGGQYSELLRFWSGGHLGRGVQ